MASLREEIGQLLWMGFEGDPGPLLQRIHNGEVGAVVLFARNLPRSASDTIDLRALRDLNERLGAANPADPPLRCVDQEGGRVQRIREPATVWPPVAALSRIAGGAASAVAERVGEAVGRELAALGFDLDFAPVLDVHSNPANPIIGDRAFASDPGTVVTLAGAWARGLQRAGVLACGKHFPGHGDTSEDSHLRLPRVSHSQQRLRAVELAPFQQLSWLPSMMTAHVVYDAWEPDCPATLSGRIVGSVLRGELGYRGVIVSDDLDMHAITQGYEVGDAAVQALRAGCDALLLCRDRAAQDRVREALFREAESEPAFRQRIAESAARVRDLKALGRRYRAACSEARLELVGSPAHRELANTARGTGGDPGLDRQEE